MSGFVFLLRIIDLLELSTGIFSYWKDSCYNAQINTMNEAIYSFIYILNTKGNIYYYIERLYNIIPGYL